MFFFYVFGVQIPSQEVFGCLGKVRKSSGHAFAATGLGTERHGAAAAATCQGDACRWLRNASCGIWKKLG